MELHYTRMRAKGTERFFDPNTDIRAILTECVTGALNFLEDKYKYTQTYQDILYLHNCTRIFEIRLIEDKLGVMNQVSAYLKALDEAPKNVVQEFRDTVAIFLLCTFSLFVRRDAATDKQDLRNMFEYSRLAQLQSILSKDTFDKVKQELIAAGVYKVPQEVTDPNGIVYCKELDKVFQNIKQVALGLTGLSPNAPWDEIADACDAQFYNADIKSSAEELMSLALAYPTYKHRTLSVTDDTAS